MTLYLGRQTHATGTMTAIYTTVAGPTTRIQNVEHKLYIHRQFFSSLKLFDNLHTKTINCCDTIRLNQKGMPKDFRKTMTHSDIRIMIT